MEKAIWEGVVLADCSDTVVVEGNHYFPPHSDRCAVFQAQRSQTERYVPGRDVTCAWRILPRLRTESAREWIVRGDSNCPGTSTAPAQSIRSL